MSAKECDQGNTRDVAVVDEVVMDVVLDVVMDAWCRCFLKE